MKTNMAPAATPCPNCKQIGLALDMKLKSSEGTLFPEATRFIGRMGKLMPHLSCKSGCGWETWGRTEPGYVVFSFDTGDAA